MKELGKARGLVAIGAISLLVAACGGGTATAAPSTAPVSQAPASQAPASEAPASETPSQAAGSWKIGFSNAFGIGNGFREEQLCTAKAQALVSGQVSEGKWIHQADDTYPQLQQIRDLIAADVDAIVFNPNDKEAYQAALDEAQVAGIKTIAIDAYVTDPETINLSNDQVGYGYTGAKWLFEQMGGKGKFYYMRGIVGHPADLDRHEGVLKAMSEFPEIEAVPSVDGVDTGWNPTTTTTAITTFINSGGYDDVQGVWTSGMDSQVVDAIQAAGKTYVPIVGADLKAFVGYLLNKDGKHEGLKGIAVYNPAAVGGAGVNLALKALNGQDTGAKPSTVKNSAGDDIEVQAVFLPTPEAYANDTPEGIASLEEIYVAELPDLYPVSWYIDGWTDYSFEQMQACKGPGE